MNEQQILDWFRRLIRGNPFKRKCVFCGETNEPMMFIKKYYAYSSIHYDYHRECLRDTICNPEGKGTGLVDVALEIQEIISKDIIDKDIVDTQRKKDLSKRQAELDCA